MMMRILNYLGCAVLAGLFCLSSGYAESEKSLAGEWSFSLDADNKGLAESWQKDKTFKDKIKLPGTTDEAGYGEKTTGSDFGILTRAYKYVGPAWYQRTIDIPADWTGKRIFLELERVMWESKVYLDGKEISTQDALSTPHWHDLGFLAPGKHTLTLRINNDMIHNIGDKGHTYSEYTQSIWNGVVGRIRLVARDTARLTNPQYTTKVNPARLDIRDRLINESDKDREVDVTISLKDRESGKELASFTKKQSLPKGGADLVLSEAMPAETKLWCDSEPNLYEVTASIVEQGKVIDTLTTEIGFREITSGKDKLLVNGKRVFLRGNLDCVHFPLTGYSPCSVEDWERVFKTYKDYGLNHVRFHSWCPPEEAFIAANRLGIYIQSEVIWIDWWMTDPPTDRKDMYTKGTPKGLGKNPSADAFVQQELANMVKFYGNYPSFAMMCIGNELGNSDFDVMETWVKPYRDTDARRLYSVSTARRIMPVDQYMATHNIHQVGATRGLGPAPSTDWDFESVYSQSDIPIIAHEIGQWPVYPKWSEIDKYTGTLKARNFEEFREEAKKNNIDSQNADFVMASGALNQIMYKYETESFLRTPSCAGIQLLSMQDYQGQGEALIGWLDAFYDSKGITTPEDFRRHHDEQVCLLRLPKRVWQNNETLTAKLQFANYSSKDVQGALLWSLKDADGKVLASGKTDEKDLKSGTSVILDEISAPLDAIKTPTKCRIDLALEGTKIANDWDIWVYPPLAETDLAPRDVVIVDSFDDTCKKALADGKKVLLKAATLGTDKTAVPIGFYPLYWSYTFFPGQGTNTIGMLLQNEHPALAEFPTDKHSDWQWQQIYTGGAKGFILNNYDDTYKPIAQPVDDFHRNNKLATIFELKVGKGKLLACGFDLDNKQPATQWLTKSLLDYMNSDAFAPTRTADVKELDILFDFVRPVKSEVPKEFEKAILYVECGANHRQDGRSLPWSEKSDRAEAKRGVTYNVKCDGTWKDGSGYAWHGRENEVVINCPQGVIGTLYVLFRDWNNNGRKGKVFFEGREYALGEHKGEGSWVKIDVMREDTNKGKITLKTQATGGPNLQISKIAFVTED